MDSKKVVKMLNFLRGRVGGKDLDKKAEAEVALATYNEIGDPQRKHDFLAAFEANGSGKQGNSLKFVSAFKKSVKNVETEEIGVVDHQFLGPSGCVDYSL